jgi:peptidoglycan/LPS O-acetylase OafA/YrhL
VRNLYVDRLRGLASLGVVLSHGAGYGILNILIWVQPSNAIADCIAVNAFHAVALFFVISGFLITTKLLGDSDKTGCFSLLKFYRDRVARIMPCLLLMLAAACALAAIGVKAFAVNWSEVPSALWAVFTFQYNGWLITPKPTPMPRIWDVLWSLSIEEVFYLVFPALMLLLPRRLLIASLAALVVFGPIHRSLAGATFYDYFSNFDLLAIGVLTALLAHGAKASTFRQTTLRACRWVGISIALVTAAATTDPLKAIVWGPECVALGAAIYLFGCATSERPRSLGILRVPELFGRLSYEVYLFHLFFLVWVGHISGLPQRTAEHAFRFDAVFFFGYLGVLALLCSLISRFCSEPANRLIKFGASPDALAYRRAKEREGVMFIKQRIAIVEWAEDHENLFDDRLFIVSGLYLFSFLEFDVGIVKSFAAVFAVYVMMVLPLGRRFVEYLSVLLFAAAMARWTDIAGINALASAAHQGLRRFAQY